jgi:serine/threonine protein kinase
LEKGTKGAGTFQRFEIVGQTPHVHEREGIEWLRAALPTYGPFGGYALFSFQTDDGRRYEIDAIALTAHCLYVIEMKSWQGRVTDGDVRHLVTTSARRGREVVDHPLPLLETKTKTFAARVKRVARSLGRDVAAAMDALWFDSLVWLTHADQGTDLGPFDAARAHLVLGKAEIGDALRQARFPGARADLAQRTVTHDTLKQLRKVLQSDAFGLNKIQKPPTVLGGQYELSRLVGEGDDYQDHLATPHHEGPKVRVRSYLAPHTDRAFVEKLERRARREHDLLTRLGDHPDILAVTGFDPAGPLGPAIVFRGFDGKPLDALVKERRAAGGRTDLGLDDKLAILRRVADALTFCHENEVVHGALSPEAVLVAAPPGAPVQVKLTRFALAAAGDPVSDGTRLFTRLAGASASVYEAPELVRGGAPTPASDLFSLAALAYFLLAEEAPAPSAADLARRLDRDGGLLLSAVRDDLFPGAAGQDVDAVLSCATGVDPLLRAQGFCSPREFVDRLEDALTAPAAAQPAAPEAPAPPPDPDPLHAAKGTVLKGGIEVLAELGSGATARVFKVHHPTEDVVALKVPLSETHDDQIAEEWQILRRLGRVAGVDRVARGIEAVTLAGRTCLLVQLAGDRTLADEIRAEGALSLDYARRWGDDLLTALRSLEEAGVQHRDIKPANIGLTSGAEKGKKRLLLFDFSLAHRAATEIGIGTPAYKDPELPVRGRWDDAADRWAAAITIHEMFTGVRPAPAPGAAKGPAVRLAPERFDADVRDGLVRFFERAFQASAADRFATADDMRDAFTRALHKVPEHDARGAAPEPELSPAALSGLGRDAPVAALPLSTRQRNALDRMGIYTLDDLAQLSTNRLGAVRGVGAKTARSLVEIAETVRKHLSISATAPPAPFLRGFGGARRPVEDEAEAGRLSPALARRFAEAGLADAAAVASAPHAHVKNLVQRARKDGAPESARDVTAWLEGLVSAEKPPATLAAAVAALLPSRGAKTPAWLRRTRVFVGLESVPGFPRFGTMSELAAAERVSRAAISIDIGRAREHWLGASRSLPLPSAEPAPVPRGLAALSRAFAAVAAALQASAGVVPLPRAAAAVLEALPPEPDLPPEEAQTSAEAIVRALTEVDAAPLGGPAEARLRLRRDERAGRVLVAWDRAGFDLAEALGELADALVAGARVVAEPEAAASLAEALRGPLASVSGRSAEAAALPERALVALAASTARVARLSARGELYPAGLAAGSALQWSAAAITSRIELDELARRVRARYPDAAPFPEDPAEIEALARSLDLRFDRDQGALLPRERTLALPSGTSAVSLSQGTEPAGPVSLPEPAAEERSGPAAGPASPPAPSPAALASPGAAAAPASAPPAPATSAAPPLPPAYLRKERSESDIRGAAALRVFDEELDRARRDGLFRVLLWRGHPATHDRPSDRGAPDAEHAARAVARRTSGQHLRLDACLLDAAAAVAVEKKIRNGLEPAIEADRLGPSGPAWPRLLDLMRLAAARAVASLPADRPRVLTRLGLLARYDLLSVLAELAAAHRAPAASSGAALPAPRAATFVVLPVFTGEGPVVEVQSDVARAGSLLVQVPGVLRHEILELPSVWLERQAERRSASAPAFPAVRP